MEQTILENCVSTQESFKFVRLLVFVHTDASGYEVLGFESAISHHGENINHVMGETRSAVIGVFAVVFHFELTARHLGDTVVDSLAGVDCSLEIGIFKGKHGSASLGSFVTRSNVDEDAKVDSGGN